jgi:hypothetical protein
MMSQWEVVTRRADRIGSTTPLNAFWSIAAETVWLSGT